MQHEEPIDPMDQMIVHTPCGLPIELCECPDAKLRYDSELDAFVENEGLPDDT